MMKTRKVAKKATRKPVKKTVKKIVKKATKKVTRKVTIPAISKTKALNLMTNNKGHFFTATFISKKKGERTINCKCLKDQTNSHLGYVKVKEAIKAKMKPNDAIRQINLQTLKSLKIGGTFYKVR